MRSKKFIVCIFSLLLSAFLLVGFSKPADDLITKIANQLNNWASDHPQEKVYLQTDKSYYAAGEDIWFKAYVTVGHHELSTLSGIVNVELVDQDDSVKQRLRIPLTDGLGWGDFALADTVKEGNYRMRAYTNWMRNAGDDYFFDKTIYIGNSIADNMSAKATYQYSIENGLQKVTAAITYNTLDGTPYTGKQVDYEVLFNSKNLARGKGITDNNGTINLSFTSKKALINTGHIITTIKLDNKKLVAKTLLVNPVEAKADVQFFPEGGSLVNDIRSRVAFKAVGANGLGITVKGVMVDNENHEVAAFATQHLGMGIFAFTPESGKTYKANITYPDGTQNSIDMPKATESGYTLSLYNNEGGDSIIAKISVSRGIMESGQGAGINIVAQSGGMMYYAAKGTLTNINFHAKVAKKLFPTGIVQFTLFSDAGEPLCERLVFVKNPDQLKLNVVTDKNTYTTREHVKIDLSALDKNSKPAVGSFSASVIDESKVPTDETSETTILSNLLLTSDLKGYVEKPNYYFMADSDKTGADIDALMMTQGYRRFEWKQLLDGTLPPPQFKAEKKINIAGHIKTLSGKPVVGGKVNLFTTAGGMPFLIDTVSDAKGNFVFNDLTFKDSVRFVIQARTVKNGKNVEIDLDDINPQLVTKNKNAAGMQVNIRDVMSNYLQNSKKQYSEQLKYGVGNHAIALKEVTITEKKSPVPNSSNLNGPGNADQVIKSDQLGHGCVTLAECLQGRLLGVTFRGGVPYSTRGNTKMHLIIDGLYIDDDTFWDSINTEDIASIEVLRSGYLTSIYGYQGAGGLLVITTKRGAGDDTYRRYTPGIITYAPRGYYLARQFYSLRYDAPKTNTQMADLRTTIFWNPNIVTDKDGKASIDFFNADGKGTYRVVIEGLDIDGNIGRQVYRYKVE